MPIVGGIESLFIRNIYRKGSDAVNRVISSVPGTIMTMPDRTSNDYGWTYEFGDIINSHQNHIYFCRFPGTSKRVLNMGSYNYLGFAQNRGPCADAASTAIDDYGVGVCSSSQHFGVCTLFNYIIHRYLGNLKIHRELELMVADFVGTEAAMCFPMGFNTNAMNIPALVCKVVHIFRRISLYSTFCL